MSNELILMLHPAFGVLAILATVWVFVETLNISADNALRLRYASVAAAILMWLAYIVGGYWYVLHYAPDKAIIKAGPWPFAHSIVMETKEHVFFSLLLLSTYLPVVAFGEDLVRRPVARRLLLWLAALIVMLGLAMEAAGAFVSMGVKMGLVGRGL